jgi:hypothetical protein
MPNFLSAAYPSQYNSQQPGPYDTLSSAMYGTQQDNFFQVKRILADAEMHGSSEIRSRIMPIPHGLS